MHELQKDDFVYVDYVGCEKRKLDAQRILNYFKANGFTATNDMTKSSILVCVTCAFIKEFEDLSMKKIEEINKNRKINSMFVVTGCLPSINPLKLEEFQGVYSIPVRRMEQFDKMLNLPVKYNEIPDPNLTIYDNREYKGKDINIHLSKSRSEYEDAKRGYKIRLGYGCLGNCSYCVTRLATKELLSKSLEIIIDEFNKALQNNEKTIFLTGGDSGAYGQDIGSSIVVLLKKLLSIRGDYKLFFHDFGVNWLIKFHKDLIPFLQTHGKNLGIFNFPIQSGSTRILKLMRRPYKIEHVIETLNNLKKTIPNLRFGTHIIVGFPGETDQDFQESLTLLKKIPFDFVMFFKYSDNIYADSYKFSNKIKESLIRERYEIIKNEYIKSIKE